MIKVIMIVVTAIFLSSWYACLVAGKRADEAGDLPEGRTDRAGA